MKRARSWLLRAVVALWASVAAASAIAQFTLPPGIGTVLPPGTPVVVTATGEVQVQFIAGSAEFTSQLHLDAPPPAPGLIFTDDLTLPGTTTSLGSYSGGIELIFRNHVINTGNNFFTGPASRNPDNKVHAQAVLLTNAELTLLEATLPFPPGFSFLRSGTSDPVVLLGFEDIFGGGDMDYNDLVFVFNNLTAVPEPSHVVLLVAGLLLIAWRLSLQRTRVTRAR